MVRAAKELARRHDREETTFHLLIAALEQTPNQVKPVLDNLGITLKGKGGLLGAACRLKKGNGASHLSEPEDTLKTMNSKACQTALRYGSHVNSLFYFHTIIRMKKAIATRVLEEAGVDFATFRQQLLARISKITQLAPADSSPADPANGTEKEPLPETTAAEAAAAVENAWGVSPKPPSQGSPVVEDAPQTSAPAVKKDKADKTGLLLDEDEYPLLTKLTRNLTAEAKEGNQDPLIGRNKETMQMLRILQKRRGNNPCLVGDPGVGKTALVEGLARAGAEGAEFASWLSDKVILELETARLVAGTQLRGSFSERLIQVRDEVKKAGGKIIIFIDEIHTIVGAGAGESALDAANELKTALARGQFPTIGATTLAEYKKYIESDKALERRFEAVYIEEPGIDEALEILAGVAPFYEKAHGVEYQERAVEAAVRLSARFITDNCLPAKAIDVLDAAGPMSKMEGRAVVTEEDIARLVSEQVGIPIQRLLRTSDNRFKEMEEFIQSIVVGHKAAITRVCDSLRRGFAGFSSNRPLATFFFAGTTGVGKEQTARALARFLFGGDDSILLFQGSEFTEKHSIAKLIGTAPGFVGHEQGGRLTEGLYRRPFRIILFRDMRVAHPDVQDLVREMIITGTLTDGGGRKVYFSNSIVILCQDLDPEKYFGNGRERRVGFAPAEAGGTNDASDPASVLARLESDFPATLMNAADERIVFFPLAEDEVLAVVKLEAAGSSRRLKEERNISFELTDAVADHVIRGGGFTKREGGRLMQQTLSRTVESFLAEHIHAGKIVSGNHVVVDYADGSLGYKIA